VGCWDDNGDGAAGAARTVCRHQRTALQCVARFVDGSSEEFGTTFIQAETARWMKVVKAAGTKAE
jgi:hypothetical protein